MSYTQWVKQAENGTIIECIIETHRDGPGNLSDHEMNSSEFVGQPTGTRENLDLWWAERPTIWETKGWAWRVWHNDFRGLCWGDWNYSN